MAKAGGWPGTDPPPKPSEEAALLHLGLGPQPPGPGKNGSAEAPLWQRVLLGVGEGPGGAGASTVHGRTAVESQGGFAGALSQASGLGLGLAGVFARLRKTYLTVSSPVKWRRCLLEQTAVKVP